MLTADLKYIVIFEISNNVPIYAPCFEKLANTFLGTFDMKSNAFADRCGIKISKYGAVFTILKTEPPDTPKNAASCVESEGDENFRHDPVYEKPMVREFST